MSIPQTWHNRDLRGNMHDDNMSIPSTYNKGISKHNMTNHGNKYITQMIPYHIKEESWKRVTNKIPHQASNGDLCNTMHRKRSTWIHCIYLTSRGHLKKRMSNFWSCSDHQSHDIESHGNDCSHINVDTSHLVAIWRIGFQTIEVVRTVDITASNCMEMTTRTWMLTPHIQGPSEEEGVKLLKLVAHRISLLRISWKWLLTHECWHMHSP